MLLNNKALFLSVFFAHVFHSVTSRYIENFGSPGGGAMSKSVPIHRKDVDEMNPDYYEDPQQQQQQNSNKKVRFGSNGPQQLVPPNISKKSGDRRGSTRVDQPQRSPGDSPSIKKKDDKLLKAVVPRIVSSILGNEPEPSHSRGFALNENFIAFDDTGDNVGDVGIVGGGVGGGGGVDELEDLDGTDEDFTEDQGIFPIVGCDYAEDNICWYNREIGDSITLALNASGFPKDSLAVRWSRIYGAVDKAKRMYLDLTGDQIPWNIVIGSGGTELRISPITNTDTDLNGLMARVYLASNSQFGKRSSKLLREIVFRVNILPIDMGSVYAGEELMIGVENFITLPLKGITLEWGIEETIGKTGPLPSNMKISKSGRTVLVKELKRTEMIISCVMYSTTGIAVAKRRFRIQRPSGLDEPHSLNLKRSAPSWGSPEQMSEDTDNELSFYGEEQESNDNLAHERRRYDIPMSRKRVLLKRSASRGYDESTKLRVYVPSLFLRPQYNRLRFLHRRYAVENPPSDHNIERRLITPPSIQKLESLGQNSDGTLDDIIPKEVHLVEPRVLLIKHRAASNATQEQEFLINCTSNYDCGPKASCIFPDEYPGRERNGHCECNTEYEGDGWRCHKPPYLRRREERVRRQVLYPFGQIYSDNEIAIKPELFYATVASSYRNRQAADEPATILYRVGREQREHRAAREPLIDEAFQQQQQQMDAIQRRRSLYPSNQAPYFNSYPDDGSLNEKRSLDVFAEAGSLKALSSDVSGFNEGGLTGLMGEDEFEKPLVRRSETPLINKCTDRQECSPHATCETSPALITICQCENGFRGNGIFCWETME